MNARALTRLFSKVAAGKKLTSAEERFMKKLQPKVSKEEKARIKTMCDVRDADEMGLAKAMKEYLLAGLPAELLKFKEFFSALPEIPKKERRFLGASDKQAKAIREATEPYGSALANYGLTMLNLFNGINAVESLINRAIRRDLVESGKIYLKIEDTEVSASPEPVSGQVLADEIYRFITQHTLAKDERLAAKLILLWVAKAARWKPRIFRGLVAARGMTRSHVFLSADSQEERDEDLPNRWKSES